MVFLAIGLVRETTLVLPWGWVRDVKWDCIYIYIWQCFMNLYFWSSLHTLHKLIDVKKDRIIDYQIPDTRYQDFWRYLCLLACSYPLTPDIQTTTSTETVTITRTFLSRRFGLIIRIQNWGKWRTQTCLAPGSIWETCPEMVWCDIPSFCLLDIKGARTTFSCWILDLMACNGLSNGLNIASVKIRRRRQTGSIVG